MTASDTLRRLLATRILVLDGAIGTMLPEVQDKDALVVGDPDRVRGIHAAYLDAGADIIKTNTFRATSYAINVAAARLARAAADRGAARDDPRSRFVAGVMGPMQGPADVLRDAYGEQARGLLDGGADLLLVETITDTRTARAAITAIAAEAGRRGVASPLMLSATLDLEGHLPSGETLEAFAALGSEARALAIGLNCAHGIRGMATHIAHLAALTDSAVGCHPSAGLPDVSGHYRERPEDTAALLRDLAERGLVNIVGSCCGTTPAYTRAIAGAVKNVPAAAMRKARGGSTSAL